MPRFGTSLLEFPLEIIQGHLDIEHSHVGRSVAGQFHQSGKTDASAKHFRGIGMPQLVRDDASRQAQSMTDLVQIAAELSNEGILGAAPGQEPAIGRPRVEEAKEA